jgi:hypothetical protein
MLDSKETKSLNRRLWDLPQLRTQATHLAPCVTFASRGKVQQMCFPPPSDPNRSAALRSLAANMLRAIVNANITQLHPVLAWSTEHEAFRQHFRLPLSSKSPIGTLRMPCRVEGSCGAHGQGAGEYSFKPIAGNGSVPPGRMGRVPAHYWCGNKNVEAWRFEIHTRGEDQNMARKHGKDRGIVFKKSSLWVRLVHNGRERWYKSDSKSQPKRSTAV